MPSADLSQRFQEVLANYLEAKERGERVDAQALLRAHPELAADLNEYFANEKQFASAAGMAASAPTPGRTAIGQRVGEYEILGEIARGGMGVVYRARHVALQRLVALKMMLGGEFAGREGLRRFGEEAKVVAELDHANIVPIYETGAHDGQAFYAMKLIDGPSLKEEIAWYVGKPKQAARLIIQVARAIHHAHQRGVLHRDLKPGNILLQIADCRLQIEKNKGRSGKKDYPVSGIPQSAIGTLQSAIPYVADFGLAKRFRADGQASHSTAVVGTAAYMAPEQATGKEALTVAADVYSLGAILYELLTGSKPFAGDNPMEVLLKVVNEEPASPRELRPGLDADLAQICLKCLRKKPSERYASADALAVELVQWLEGETLTVRAPTLPERSWRWCRRHPIATGLIGMIVLAVAGAIGLSLHLDHIKEASQKQLVDQEIASARKLAEGEYLARIAAEKAKTDAEKAKADIEEISTAKEKAHAAESLALKESRRLLVQHYIGNGQQILQRGDVFGSAIWFAKALEHEPDEPIHRIRLGMLLRLCPPLEQMWFFDSKIRLLRLSPSGDRLLIGAKGDEAALWDAQTGRQLGAPMRHEGGITAAEFSPDGQWLVTAGADASARLWTAATGLPHGTPLKHAQSIHAVAFSSDSSRVATASADKTARVWAVATTKPAGAPFVHAQEVRLAAFHPDGKKLLTVCANSKGGKGELHVWDLAKEKPYFEPWPYLSKKDKKDKAEVKGILDAGFSRDGRHLFAVTSGHKIFLWDAKAGGPPIPSAGFVKGDAGNWFSPALDKLVSAAESEVKLIDVPGGAVAHTWRHDSPIELAQFSPGGRFVAITSANGGVRLMRADTGTPFGPALSFGAKVAGFAFSHNDQWLATVSDDHSVRLWNLAWVERDKMVALPKNKGTLFSGSPNGRHALLAQAKSTVIWDLDQGRAVGALLPLSAATPLLTRWSADGASVAVASAGEVRQWEVPSGKAMTPTKELNVWGKKMLENKNKTTHLLDCDGQRLAAWKTKGTLEIQDVSGEMAKTLKLAVVPDVFRFSPDRRHGAAGFADGSLRLWDLAEGKPATTPFWHGEPIRQIAYSADGGLLASAGASGRIRVWDARTGQALSGDLFAAGPLVDLAFRADAGMLHAWTESRVQHWSLQAQPGSAADLLLRTRRAAGQDIDPDSGVLVPLDAAALKDLWRGP